VLTLQRGHDQMVWALPIKLVAADAGFLPLPFLLADILNALVQLQRIRSCDTVDPGQWLFHQALGLPSMARSLNLEQAQSNRRPQEICQQQVSK